jgi:branched-chain amino acid transport system permease protein
MSDWLRENRARVSVISVLVFLFLVALGGLESEDVFSTIMQGLSVGAITFLVASGLSLIFGLMDVLNLAHGEIFMLGAYVGWTVYTRFDTAFDVTIPLLVLAAPFVLWPLWRRLGAVISATGAGGKVTAWALLAAGGAVAAFGLTRFPLVIWDAEQFAVSPATYSLAIDIGVLEPLPEDAFSSPALIAYLAVLIGAAALALALAAMRRPAGDTGSLSIRHVAVAAGLLAGALVLHAAKAPINEWVFGLSTTWRFFLAMAVAVAIGAAAGAMVEVVLIRPLYDRPIYQLMLTLGVGFILIEVVREVWGRTEFNMPRPAAFNGSGAGCPGEGIGGVFSGCATMELFGSRLRVYNEVFIVLVGILVLVGVTLLLRRTRIGMIIRAGVQDAEMVEALGINVRRVFTLVFALGSGLAALGGVLAAPSIGLSPTMGALLLLSALIALAIGGLTSFPGAAAGALLVGLIQQVIIRFGQTGIDLPFLDEPFKPSPTVVPAASVLLMVVVLLVLPTGLFGRSER